MIILTKRHILLNVCLDQSLLILTFLLLSLTFPLLDMFLLRLLSLLSVSVSPPSSLFTSSSLSSLLSADPPLLLTLSFVSLLLLELFNLTHFVGEGDFLVRFLLLLETAVLVSTELFLFVLAGVLFGGLGDLDLLLLDLTAFPVITRSELLTDFSPVIPNTGGFRLIALATAGAW